MAPQPSQPAPAYLLRDESAEWAMPIAWPDGANAAAQEALDRAKSAGGILTLLPGQAVAQVTVGTQKQNIPIVPPGVSKWVWIGGGLAALLGLGALIGGSRGRGVLPNLNTSGIQLRDCNCARPQLADARDRGDVEGKRLLYRDEDGVETEGVVTRDSGVWLTVEDEAGHPTTIRRRDDVIKWLPWNFGKAKRAGKKAKRCRKIKKGKASFTVCGVK